MYSAWGTERSAWTEEGRAKLNDYSATVLARPLNGLGRTERERKTGRRTGVGPGVDRADAARVVGGVRAGGTDDRVFRGVGVGVAAVRTTSLPDSVATSVGALTNGVTEGVRDAAPVRPTNAVDARRRYGWIDGNRIDRNGTGVDGRMFSKSSSVGGTDDCARSTVSTETDRGHSKNTSPLSPLRGGRRLVGDTLRSRGDVGELDDTSYAADESQPTELGVGDAGTTWMRRDEGGGERKRTLLGVGDGATVNRGPAPGFFIAERNSDGAGLADGNACRMSCSDGAIGVPDAASAAAAAAVRARVCLTGVSKGSGGRLTGSAGMMKGEAGVSLRAELGGVDVGRALNGDRRPRKSSMSDNSVDGDRARIGGEGDGASDIR